ncbi:MAG: 5'/3'-nucleotidase SurE [Deltaproteobacteria bacterium]|nr:5'/3'-nucleotidase SurE [Deltaproteobacteria bacterium]
MPIDTKRDFKKSNHRKPLFLVTNDDGVYSEGIRMLAKALKQVGHVVIVAPSVERSAASHALTLHRPLRIAKISRDVYAVDGTPTDCVNLGVNEVLRRTPDLLISGINRGGNLGDDVHYSGTVSAALEGGILGIPSVAISLHARDHFRFQGACTFAVRLARKLLHTELPRGTILNVNVPNIPKNRIRGYVFTKQGKRNYGDIVVEKIDPRGRKYYWIGGDDAGFEDIPDSDCNAVLDRHISISPIRVDMTDHGFLQKMQRWKL